MSLATTLLLPVRGAQALFALIVMALMADCFAHFWDPPSEVGEVYINLVFSVWALLNLAYLVIAPIAFPKAANKWAILVIETLTMILWIASFVSLADFTSQFCHIPSMREKKCNEFIAAVVFGAFSSVLFIGTTILAALHCWRTRGGNGEPAYTGA